MRFPSQPCIPTENQTDVHGRATGHNPFGQAHGRYLDTLYITQNCLKFLGYVSVTVSLCFTIFQFIKYICMIFNPTLHARSLVHLNARERALKEVSDFLPGITPIYFAFTSMAFPFGLVFFL